MPQQKKETETIYQGRDVWINQRTGEAVQADHVVRKVQRQGFEITYLAYFMDLFDKLGGKKYVVFKYIIENKSKADNTLIITIRELAEKTKTSSKTVHETLKLLREAGLIASRTGSIMVLPKIAHYGNNRKEAYLMQKFEAFE